MRYGFDFKGKSVLITGAAGEIGIECVRAFLQNGAKVYITDISGDMLGVAEKRLLTEYPEAQLVKIVADITDSNSVKNMLDTIRNLKGDIDILVNNAGVSHSVYSTKERLEDWNRVINVNLTGQFFTAQAVVNEFMLHKSHGKIINMGSLGGVTGLPGAVAYSASKGGLVQMTKSLASEWARFGINVNCVCPGFVNTAFIKENLENQSWMNYMMLRIPKHRLAEAEDIAGAVIFLASPMAEYITGEAIIIDGGFTSGS